MSALLLRIQIFTSFFLLLLIFYLFYFFRYILKENFIYFMLFYAIETLPNDVMSDVMMIPELKFNQEKWQKGEFDID